MTPAGRDILRDRHKREQGLWAAVINQALMDATGVIEFYCANKEYEKRHKAAIRNRARDWFKDAGKDFKEVCALADVDPDWIRANALKKIAEAGDEPARKRQADITAVVNGETLTVAQIAERTGLSKATIVSRIKVGVTGDQLLAPSRNTARHITHNGETRKRPADALRNRKKAHSAFILSAMRPRAPSESRLPRAPRLPREPRPPKIREPRAPRPPREPKERQVKLHTFAGKSLTLKQWSAETGIPLTALYHRLGKLGWTLEKALTTPLIDPKDKSQGRQPSKFYEHDGLSLSMAQWSERLGIKETTLWQRLHNGWSVERTLSTPVQARAA